MFCKLTPVTARFLVVAGEDGQLGHGDAEEVWSPRGVAGLDGLGPGCVTSVSCGAEYTVAVSPRNREVWSWGW